MRIDSNATVTIETMPITRENLPSGPRWEMDGACWRAEACDPHPVTGQNWRWVPLNPLALYKDGPGAVLIDHYPALML